MGTEKRQVAHAHPATVVFLDQRHRAQYVEVVNAFGPQGVDVVGVDQVNDLHVPRQHAFHQADRPGFQRFGQQCVVGVGQRIDGDLPRGVPRHVINVDQLPHQFSHGNRGVSVVELDRGVIAQGQHRGVHVAMAAQQILQRGGDEEVLLAQAQLLAGLGAVRRVQHPGDAFGPGHFGHGAQVVAGVETLQVQIFHGPGTPQAQRVDARPAPADHRRVVGNRSHGFRRGPDLSGFAGVVGQGLDTAAETDGVSHFRPLELPRVAEIQPVFGLLLLPAIDNRLAEQPVLIADAVAMTGDAEGRHAFQETRRQTPEAAVAQGRIGLQHANALKVDAEFGQGFAGHVEQAEIAQAVEQQPTDEKFQGEVIDALLTFAVDLPRVVHPVLDHVVPRGQGNGFEPVVVEGVIRVFTHCISELGQDGVAECGHLCFANKWFLSHR
ncbi:hypothetical protein D3C72_1033070 [compost metagenome]